MSKVVANGESVVLLLNSSKYLFADVDSKKRLQVGKQNIATLELAGKQYGATFSVDRGKLVPIKPDELMELKNELAPEAEAIPDANNSLLVDDNTSQKLSQADIAAMKSQGVSGKDVIKAIVGNSSTFHTKTDFSKEKYLKKKSQKHITTVQILRGTANTILTAYYDKNPAKICNLRGDSLALLLNLSNVFAHPDKKVLVVENCQGLIVGSVAERMGGLGKIYFANLETSQPSTAALRSFNFSKQVEDSIITFPFTLLSSFSSPPSTSSESTLSSPPISSPIPSDQTEKPEKMDQTEQTEQKDKQPEKKEKDAVKEAARARMHEEAQELARDGADSLLVVSKYAPQSIMPQLVRALKGGAAFAVYSQYLQPLAETHELLRSAGIAVNMSLAETWLRVHQVLPGRTHPNMQMDGASGYILNGIRVIPNTEEKKKVTKTNDTNRKGKGKANEGDGEEGKGTKRKSSVDGEDQPEQKLTKTDASN
eukprot:Phypoly_transcript_00933.p2 GENE.Phypoly_transcript_00933~~Phypoly_transcript_00933.p2  ORF type:complete len:482 (+),score=139.02 Phypoly_transcript_00933:2424-3869(+)